MSYDEKFARARDLMVKFVDQEIAVHYNTDWDYESIREAYVTTFVSEFEPYMNYIVLGKMRVSGTELANSIQTFLATTPEHTLASLLTFVDTKLNSQLDAFETWCSDIKNAILNCEKILRDMAELYK